MLFRSWLQIVVKLVYTGVRSPSSLEKRDAASHGRKTRRANRFTNTRACAHAHTRIHTQAHTYVRAHTHSHTLAPTQTLTHLPLHPTPHSTYTHTHTSTHTHIHTHTMDVCMPTAWVYHWAYLRCHYRWCRVLGYMPQELCGQSMYKFIHPKDLQMAAVGHHRGRYSSSQGWSHCLFDVALSFLNHLYLNATCRAPHLQMSLKRLIHNGNYSTVICFWADPLRSSHVRLNAWLSLYTAHFKYPLKWLKRCWVVTGLVPCEHVKLLPSQCTFCASCLWPSMDA